MTENCAGETGMQRGPGVGNVINNRIDEAIAAVEIGWSAKGEEIERVVERVRSDLSIGRKIIQIFRKRIAQLVTQSFAQALVQRNLQRVIGLIQSGEQQIEFLVLLARTATLYILTICIQRKGVVVKGCVVVVVAP